MSSKFTPWTPGGVCTHCNPLATKIAADPAARTVTAIISTSEPDRAGDVVVPVGLRNRDEYLRNPVVLWAHRRDLPPIGTCLELDVQPNQVVAVTQFARGLPMAEELFGLYESGVLRGWSIGFIPLRAERRTTGDAPGRHGLRIEEWELIEYSAVPVPENAGALTVAVQKGVLRDATLRAWFDHFTDPFTDLVA